MARLDPSESFADFRDRTLEGIRSHFPVKGRTQTLELDDLEVDSAGMESDDIRGQHRAKVEGASWSAPVYATMSLRDNETGKAKKQRIKLAELPMMTRRYSYIVNGQEYQVDNQWQLKPGVYTRRRQNGELESRFNIVNKPHFDLKFEPDKKRFLMERGKSSAIPLYPLMKSLGISDDDLEKTWGKEILEQNKAARGVSGALEKFYKADRKKSAPSKEEAERYFYETMMQSELRPEATKRTLGKEYSTVEGDAVLRATKRMLEVQSGAPEDDRDSLVFKDLRGAGDYAFDRLTDYKTRRSLQGKMGRQINNARSIRDVIRPGTFDDQIRRTFTENKGATRVPEQINPVEMIAGSQQTTVMGPGGIQSENAIMDETKFINPTHFGFLDPIHTPEGNKTGVTLHLPMGVSKKGKSPVIPVYNLKTGKGERITPEQFMDSTVALPDQMKWKDNKPTPVGKKVKVSTPGNELDEVDPKDAKYAMYHPSQAFSITSNLVPFMGNTSGNRASYATHHIEQAISLKDRDVPLVQSGTGGQREGLRTFEELLGRGSSHPSPMDGEVVKVKKDGVIVKGKDGKTREIQLYNNFPLNDAKAVIDSTPTVKVGDKVKQGQPVADTNFTKNGTLALGKNLRTAYLPFKGYNFEDGVVISESAAKKLTSVHMHKPDTRVADSDVTDPKKFRVFHPEAFTKDQYKLVGDDGIVRVGTRVQKGDPLVLNTKPYQLRDRTGIAAVRKNASGAQTDASLKWDSDYAGEVVGVHRGKKGQIGVHVRTEEPMQVGDKLTGRHGNKGIVTKVIPDKEMPHTRDGKPIEVALNPAGVPGRMNVGQVLETAAAKVAEKTGKPYIVENFEHGVDQLKRVKSDLKKHGLSDTEELIDPNTGKSLGNVLVGPQHMLKLQHQVDKKASARSGMSLKGEEGEGYDYNLQPVGGSKTGAQSVGNLGIYTLLAHGAKANIREMQTWKSEGEDTSPEGKRWASQHNEVWRAIQSGDPLPPPKPTFAFHKFTEMLKAAGINVEKRGNTMQLNPLTNQDILNMSAGELSKPADRLRQGKLDENGDPMPMKGGLFDPKLTGGHGGKKWTHFKLAEPVPNPVFEGAIQRLTGLTGKQYESVVNGEQSIDLKTRKVVPLGKGATGGPAIKSMLDGIDVNKELEQSMKELEAVKLPSGFAHGASTTKLDKAMKKVRHLQVLKDKKMSPSDAYMLENVPVIPPAMRTVSVLKDGGVRWGDLNQLYSDLAQTNGEMGKMKQRSYFGDKDLKDSRKDVYDGLRALVGIGSSPAEKEAKNKGVLQQIAGSQPKKGYFQNTLMNRRQDMSMRSTIVPEPAMGLDEVGIPQEHALKLFRPFVVKKMMDIGVAPTELDAQHMLAEKKKDKGVWRALDLAMEDRPVLMKRDPALHKHSMQAFRPYRTSGHAIKIHPLVTNGYNADFDGDTMSMFVPISKEAVDEAKQMQPSNNLFNEAQGKVTYTPTLESSLGLYKMSRVRGDGKQQYKNPTDVLKAVEAGKLPMDELVTVGKMKTTGGRIMLSSALPKPLQNKMLTDHKFVLDKNGVHQLYTDLAKNHRADFGEAANKLKDFGFDASYGSVRVAHPQHKGPNAIAAMENPKQNVKFLPMGAHTLSLDDLEPDREVRDREIAKAQKQVDKIRSMKGLSKLERDRRSVAIWEKADADIARKHVGRAEARDDRLHQMLAAGTKPSWSQYKQLKLAPMVMQDAANRDIPTPIKHSYSEGLDMGEYWTGMHGARRGTVLKVQEVQEPGYFSKQLINTTMNMVVNKDDCGTKRGIAVPVGSKDIYDRELAAPVTVKGKTFKPGTILGPDLVAQIRSHDKNAQLVVRSALRCEHGDGLCQHCAGLSADGTYYKKGSNLGVLSAQSLGERAVQLPMKMFHSGGVKQGGRGGVVGMFDRTKQLTELPKKIPDASTLAMHSGTVDKVERDPTGTNVWIGGQRHHVPKDRSGMPLHIPLPGEKVKGWQPPRVGMKVEAGQSLSDPTRTFVNPHDLYKATRSMEKVQNHLVNELHGIYSEEGVRRQHIETVVKAMGNLTRVRNPGDAQGILKGEYQPTSRLRELNRQLSRQGKKPVQHSPILKGIDVMPLTVQEDWMAKLNYAQLQRTLTEGAAIGAKSHLHGTHPIPAAAYGAEFGLTEKHKKKYPHLAKVPSWSY